MLIVEINSIRLLVIVWHRIVPYPIPDPLSVKLGDGPMKSYPKPQ